MLWSLTGRQRQIRYRILLRNEAFVLVGYMAAGKTTLGRRAAQLLNVEFIDLDAYIEYRYRKRVSDLFAERGEEGFRDIERRMLHEVAEFDNVLVATGGGTPCFSITWSTCVTGESRFIWQLLYRRCADACPMQK